jgi:hypothetical protein
MVRVQRPEADGFVTAYPAMTEGVVDDPHELEIRQGEVFVSETGDRRMLCFVRTSRS